MSVFTNPADAAADEAAAYIDAVLGLLGDRDPHAVLAGTAGALRAIVEGVPADRLRAAERPGRWSAGEVLAHLADSELVWAFRLRMVLAQDRPALGGYDQDAWARRLDYAEIAPERSLERFERMRSWNLELLDRTPDANMDRVGLHGERGEESVRHMVRLYAGHDLVHLAQIRRIVAKHGGLVRHANAVDGVDVTAGRGTVRRVLIDPDEAPRFALRKFTMQPGGGMPRHTNAVEHEQYVLGGRARIGIGEDEFEVSAGDVVFIPAGVPHWYDALGDDEPFEFLCTVPNVPDAIEILD